MLDLMINLGAVDGLGFKITLCARVSFYVVIW